MTAPVAAGASPDLLRTIHGRRRVALLILIMVMVATVIGTSAIFIIYKGGIERERVRLQDIAQTHARVLDSIVQFDSRYSTYPEGAAAGAVVQFTEVFHDFTPHGLGRSGEVTLARLVDDTMVFLLRHRRERKDAPMSIPVASGKAPAMRRALSGQSGTMTGIDYAGNAVLAAYEPVPALALGLVVKIDVAEVRQRFIHAALPVIAVAAAAVFAAIALFFRITEPVLRRIGDSEASFRGTFDNAAVGIAHVAFDGAWLRVNDRLCDIVGYSREELLRTPGRAITHPDDLPAESEGFASLARGEVESNSLEKRFFHKRGHSVWVNLTMALQRGNDGRPLYCISVIEDISRRKQVESELRRLYQAIQQSPSSVVITEADGTIVYVNPKFCEVTGYDYDDVIGHNPRVLKSGHTSDDEYAQLWDTIASGRTWQGEFQNRKKNGEYYWEVASIAPVKDDHGTIINYVAVKEDVTERRAVEQQLRQSQKMQAVGQLTGGIAHDFNNLLTIILGNLQLLERDSDLRHRSARLITDALWAAQRGGELTHRLLAFARMQPLEPAPVNLNHVVCGLTQLLRRTLGTRVDVDEALDPDIPGILADTGELERALVNLAINARDAMPEGGRLTLRTGRAVLDETGIERYPDVAAGRYVLLAVSDTGVGIPPDLIGRIFEPFFTTKRAGEGSGLGLSMVWGFVKQSGGHISVDSQPGAGTTFTLFFPEVASDLGRGGTDAESGVDFVAKGEIALVVEDEERLRVLAHRLLVEAGFVVLVAADAEQALRHADAQPRIDLLFSDVELPGALNGLAVAQQVRERHPKVAILYTTGYSAALADGRTLADAPVLAKPYARQQLLQQLHALFPHASAEMRATMPGAARARSPDFSLALHD